MTRGLSNLSEQFNNALERSAGNGLRPAPSPTPRAGNGDPAYVAVTPNHQARDEINALVMAAEHASAIADDLAEWATGSYESNATEQVERWKAVSQVRKMASEKWSIASRRLYTEMG